MYTYTYIHFFSFSLGLDVFEALNGTIQAQWNQVMAQVGFLMVHLWEKSVENPWYFL